MMSPRSEDDSGTEGVEGDLVDVLDVGHRSVITRGLADRSGGLGEALQVDRNEGLEREGEAAVRIVIGPDLPAVLIPIDLSHQAGVDLVAGGIEIRGVGVQPHRPPENSPVVPLRRIADDAIGVVEGGTVMRSMIVDPGLERAVVDLGRLIIVHT